MASSTGSNTSSPSSKDHFKDTLASAKSESKIIAGDVASMIAGGRGDELSNENRKVLGENLGPEITTYLVKSVPKGALIYGGLGLLPYFGTTLSTLYLTKKAYLAAVNENRPEQDLSLFGDLETISSLLSTIQTVQLGYGASILTFLGAVHAGFLWSGKFGSESIQRYAITIAPLAVAWTSVLLPWEGGMTVQWAGFLGMWFADVKASRNQWCPRWYSTFRFYLTSIVGSCIIASLAVYYHYEPGQVERGRKVYEAKHLEKTNLSVAEGTVKSNATVVDAGEKASTFNVIKKIEPKEEQAKQEDAQEKARKSTVAAKQEELSAKQDSRAVRVNDAAKHLEDKKKRESVQLKADNTSH